MTISVKRITSSQSLKSIIKKPSENTSHLPHYDEYLDNLSPTFPSIIGHTYIFSFAYVYSGNGSLNSGEFLIRI
jgi:hypothetical protein